MKVLILGKLTGYNATFVPALWGKNPAVLGNSNIFGAVILILLQKGCNAKKKLLIWIV
jgi:hypothetical protein